MTEERTPEVTEPTDDNSGPTNAPEGGAGGDSGIGAAPTDPTTTPDPVNTPGPVSTPGPAVPAKGRGGCLGGAAALIALALAVVALLVH